MTLLELLRLMKKQWYLLVIFPVVLALATGVVCWGFMPNKFTSEVSLYVLTKAQSATTNNVTSSDTAASQQLANDIAVLAKSNRVMDATASSLGMTTLSGYDISISSQTTTRVITLTVTGTDPQAVATIANELAKQTADTAVEVMDLKAVNTVDVATAPLVPSGPNRPLYLAVAVLAGLFIAIVVIVMRDLLDTTVKSSDDVEELFGLPVLGQMPAIKKGE